MLVQTSVLTTSQPATQPAGSVRTVTWAPARAISACGAAYDAGPASTRWNPNIGAASSHERAMLLEQSPTKATRLPAMPEPSDSSTVSTSQSTWTGCASSDRALMTGMGATVISRSRSV